MKDDTQYREKITGIRTRADVLPKRTPKATAPAEQPPRGSKKKERSRSKFSSHTVTPEREQEKAKSCLRDKRNKRETAQSKTNSPSKKQKKKREPVQIEKSPESFRGEE